MEPAKVFESVPGRSPLCMEGLKGVEVGSGEEEGEGHSGGLRGALDAPIPFMHGGVEGGA